MAFQARLLPIVALSIHETCHGCAIFYASNAVLLPCSICKISDSIKRPKSSQRSISFEILPVSSYCQLLARWLARLLSLIESAYHISNNASTVHVHSELNYGYRPRDPYKDILIIHEISHVLLPEQHLQGKGECTRIRYKRYKKATQTHFSYTNFYPTAVLNPTYCLPICLGSVYLIKSYNCWVNSIMTAITINYVDRPVYYNVIVKLVASMSLKGIHHQSV